MAEVPTAPSGDDDPLFENRARASSFGKVAALYDLSRPTYPSDLIDLLVSRGSSPALDAGCGTGIMSRLLLERGLDVLGVEPDPEMADVARSRGVTVEVATFEQFDDGGRRFGLLTAAQSWHWVEPVAGATAAARILRPGGLVALVWNHAEMPTELLGGLSAIYERAVPGRAIPTVGHRPDSRPGGAAAEQALSDTGAFEAIGRAVFPWSRAYTTDEWVAQLQTHSDHLLLDASTRRVLLDEVRAYLDAAGGSFTMPYHCRAVLATRR